MKSLLSILAVICLVTACRKEDNFEQAQHDLLMAHTWLLDSVYITYNGLLGIDTIKSPDFTQYKFDNTTYRFTQSSSGVPAGGEGVYRLEGVTSRIYYWPVGGQEDTAVYYTIQKLTSSELVYSDYRTDAPRNNFSTFLYFYHAK